MNYKSSCISYCEKASSGEDPCDTCKYVTDQSGYHKACRFFMTAFLDEKDPDCYHKPLNHEGLPSGEIPGRALWLRWLECCEGGAAE